MFVFLSLCAEFISTVETKQAFKAGQDRGTLGSSWSLHLDWCGGTWHHARLHAVEWAGAWGQGTRHLWETTRPAVTHITTILLRSYPSKCCLAITQLPNSEYHQSSIPLHHTICPIKWEVDMGVGLYRILNILHPLCLCTSVLASLPLACQKSS